MKSHQREIKSFFHSQYFSDGLRMSIGILAPALLMLKLGHFDEGLTMSLGALCICTIDSPGPLAHKRNGMLMGNAILFVVAMITGYARLNLIALGFEITLFAFLFSLLTVYGNRAASVGTCGLLIMIFMMDRHVPPPQVPVYCLTVLAGGVWYMLFAIIFLGIRPYRAAQQTLGESIADVANFLRIKADFYDSRTDIDENYRKLVLSQIQVSNHQDAVREILFKSRVLVRESTAASRVLVITFNDLVDMFEQIMATHYDYNKIRENFENTSVLADINAFLHLVADDLDNIGYAILANTRPEKLHNFDLRFEVLKKKIDEVGADENVSSNLILKKILINLRDLSKTITNIYKYYHSKASDGLVQKINDVEYSKFVAHQDFAPHIFFDNLTLSSGAFKHALRVSLVCLVGFITAKNFSLGGHSYWVLLTIIVILKPGFSLSKQRNYQRLIGTIVGGIIGIVILYFVPGKTAQFWILVGLMIGTYSFLRLNYVVSVIFMTPYVLILFKFLGLGHLNIVQERIVDTLIGSGIAFIASYLIFPTWEFQLVQESLEHVLTANINYLRKVSDSLSGREVSVTEYKLARKDVYVNSANLSAVFERMTSEPKRMQRNIKDLHKFVVLNHILASYTANIASALVINRPQNLHPDMQKSVKKSIAVLREAINRMAGKVEEIKPTDEPVKPSNHPQEILPQPLTADENLMKEQLGFINKVAIDLAKITDSVLR